MIWLLVLILIGVLLCSEDGRAILSWLVAGALIVGGLALALFVLVIILSTAHII